MLLKDPVRKVGIRGQSSYCCFESKFIFKTQQNLMDFLSLCSFTINFKYNKQNNKYSDQNPRPKADTNIMI